MSLQGARGIFIIFISAALEYAHAQQAVSPVERARLVQELPTSVNPKVDANGANVADDETTADDSLGEEVVLRRQPRTTAFAVTGDASVFYTDNAALTRSDKVDDVYFVANAGVSCMHLIAPHLEGQIAAHSSIFRYNRSSNLDFSSLGLRTSLFWSPDHFWDISLFAHYDFIELIDRHSDEILRDHEFTIGAQKIFSLGPAHALVAGAILRAGLAEPDSAQRDQAGLLLAYRIQATRSLGLEFLYRFAGYYYDEKSRLDRNHVFSAGLHYRLREWAEINAVFSFTDNRSDDSAFNYDALTSGGGLGATFQF